MYEIVKESNNNKKLNTQKQASEVFLCPAWYLYAWNPSYSGGRDRNMTSSNSAWITDQDLLLLEKERNRGISLASANP